MRSLAPPFRALGSLLLIVVLLGSLVGCESETAPSSYVARVGDQYLTQDDLDRRMQGMGPVPDSAAAREQVIEQWVERMLLLREALRLNLAEEAEIKRKIERQRKNTLVSAMSDRIYDEADLEPSAEDVRTYFERHRDQLQLREPYVRIRHLVTDRPDAARDARRTLQAAAEAEADSIWAQIVDQHAQSPDRARSLADQFLPEGRLFSQIPYVQDELSALRDGEIAPVIAGNDQYHVLQLVRRIPEGTDPELRWLEDEIRRRLRIRKRKQMYTREVERLRNRAVADSLIETPQ